LIVDYGSDPFSVAQGTLPWQPILASKFGKIGLFTFIHRPGVQKRISISEVRYRTSDFKRFIYDDLATICKHLVNFSPVTPEFKRHSGLSLARSVCLFVDIREPYKNGWTDRDAVWEKDSGIPNEPCVRRGSTAPIGNGCFWVVVCSTETHGM